MTGGWGGYSQREEDADRMEAEIQKRIDAAVSAARAEAFEEAAKIADDWPKSVDRMAFVMGGARAYVLESQKIAAAIRSRAKDGGR